MRRTTLVLLALGLLQVVAYGWALCVPQGIGLGCYDQGCYLQSACRIAEGFPFSYAPGQPPTTGQTSVLYPFLLALPASLGAGDLGLRAATFVFAALFYLAFLFGWGCVIDRLFPKRSSGGAAAVAMTALSGLCGYVAFTMCDQGLWMAVSALIAAAMVCERRRLELALLCLAPWIRPEGMMLVAAVVFVRVVRRSCALRDVLPLLSILGVFALNFALTGHAQFSSVAGKGYFYSLPFGEAVVSFGGDLLSLLGACLCSVPVPSRRLFCMISPVVAVAFWFGVAALLCRRRPRSVLAFSLLPFVLASALATVSVSSGGFAGLDFDRYLAWMMPLVFLAAGYGFDALLNRIRSPLVRQVLWAALTVTVLFSTVSMVAMMRRTAGTRTAHFDTVREEARRLPENASVGLSEFVWAYALPRSVRATDMLGIFSPALAGCASDPALAYEILKRKPTLRFDYWVEAPALDDSHPQFIRRADWAAYDRANESPLADAVPVTRLDVAYGPDERAAGLHAEDGSTRPGYHGFAEGKRATDGLTMCDGFAWVIRGHAFALDVRPNHAAVLVLRTIGRPRDFSRGKTKEKPVDYGRSARLKVAVNGRSLGTFDVPLQPDVFTDFRIDVPAEFLTSSRSEFRVEGRFAAFGYWLYQMGGKP